MRESISVDLYTPLVVGNLNNIHKVFIQMIGLYEGKRNICLGYILENTQLEEEM